MTGTQMTLSVNEVPAHLANMGAIGNENVDASVLATPRLYLLQALNDQVIRGNPNYVEGATPGMFLRSITNDLYPTVWVANLFFDRGYNVNKRRELGKDWRGFFRTEADALAKLEADRLTPGDYDIVETHTHTLAMIDASAGHVVTPIQFSLKGSALRDSRQWNANIVTQGASLPRFASIWQLSPKLNQNGKGSWYTPQAVFRGWAPAGLFDELKALYDSLAPSRGTVGADE